MWFTEGPKITPADAVLLADTGAFGINPAIDWGGDPHAELSIIITASPTAASSVIVQHRDVANSFTLKSQIIPVPAGGTVLQLRFGKCLLKLGERFRVIMNGALTSGGIQASIIF